MPNSVATAIETEDIPALDVALEKVCYIILRAREFDVKDVATVPDPGSNATDDGMIGVLEDRADDPTEQELRALISALSIDEQIDLVALSWLGRGEGGIRDWGALRTEAERLHATRPTAHYLLGDPLVSDYLEEALSMFGASCAAFEANRLCPPIHSTSSRVR